MSFHRRKKTSTPSDGGWCVLRWLTRFAALEHEVARKDKYVSQLEQALADRDGEVRELVAELERKKAFGG